MGDFFIYRVCFIGSYSQSFLIINNNDITMVRCSVAYKYILHIASHKG